MKYRVIVSPRTWDKVGDFHDFIAIRRQAPENAKRWIHKALSAIRSLQTLPHRCPKLIGEDGNVTPLRILRVDSCLFLFLVDDEDCVVRVTTFRHGSQQWDNSTDD
jgi:plasmid stabilization system protein ParE